MHSTEEVHRKYHVDNNSHRVRGRIASRARGREGIGRAGIAVLGKVIIRRVWQQTSQIHVVIVRQRGRVGYGDGGRSGLDEGVRAEAVDDGGVGQWREGVPRDCESTRY